MTIAFDRCQCVGSGARTARWIVAVAAVATLLFGHTLHNAFGRHERAHAASMSSAATRLADSVLGIGDARHTNRSPAAHEVMLEACSVTVLVAALIVARRSPRRERLRRDTPRLLHLVLRPFQRHDGELGLRVSDLLQGDGSGRRYRRQVRPKLQINVGTEMGHGRSQR